MSPSRAGRELLRPARSAEKQKFTPLSPWPSSHPPASARSTPQPGQRHAMGRSSFKPIQQRHAALERTLTLGVFGLVTLGFFSPAGCVARAMQ